jgi:hypothetical protein
MIVPSIRAFGCNRLDTSRKEMRAGLCLSNQAKRTSGKDGRGQSIRPLAYTSAAKAQASHKWLPRVTNKFALLCILQSSASRACNIAHIGSSIIFRVCGAEKAILDKSWRLRDIEQIS